MQVEYKTKKLKKICTNASEAEKKYGIKNGKIKEEVKWREAVAI